MRLSPIARSFFSGNFCVCVYRCGSLGCECWWCFLIFSPFLGRQKWDEEDVEMFKMTLKKFAEDLNKLSDNIKNKTINQIKGGIKRKIQDQKGLTISSPVVVKKIAVAPSTTPITNHSNDKNEPVKSDTMLNSCNASSMDSVPDNPWKIEKYPVFLSLLYLLPSLSFSHFILMLPTDHSAHWLISRFYIYTCTHIQKEKKYIYRIESICLQNLYIPLSDWRFNFSFAFL